MAEKEADRGGREGSLRRWLTEVAEKELLRRWSGGGGKSFGDRVDIISS